MSKFKFLHGDHVANQHLPYLKTLEVAQRLFKAGRIEYSSQQPVGYRLTFPFPIGKKAFQKLIDDTLKEVHLTFGTTYVVSSMDKTKQNDMKEKVEYFSFALEEALRYIEGKATISADPIAVVQQAKEMADELLTKMEKE